MADQRGYQRWGVEERGECPIIITEREYYGREEYVL